ncbi:MAG TPA: tRNA uridine-5-carboxymethylaminomethyl(34) synthesis GTPase MnmE [Gemmatimonadales bacterium]|nr:tRNA uridine-5-carboxymethylaminomethyl(34) synthesis GTPase MnmE [Gemmatimonadales bacterium]
MFSDPIAALSTPPGRSALAIVRLSGAGALEIAARVVDGFRAAPPREMRLAAFLAADGTVIDRGLYTVFPAPHSYTGDDLIEFSCHGGLVAPGQLLAALFAAGARQALAGEFTRRAVINGRMDLLQAEAVGDLIDATADRQARAAVHQLEGGLSRRLQALREALLETLALLSYDIDFPEEDDGPIPPARIAAHLRDVAVQVDRLLATAPAGERLREGALVVLAGPPNAGKSSLFNALLGRERAIVTPTPGTTRDAIEAHTEMNGWPVRLVDTAGLWDAAADLDRLGVEMSRRYLAAADLVVACDDGWADGQMGRWAGDNPVAGVPPERMFPVATKCDLHPDRPHSRPSAHLPVSSVTGEGLDTLRSAIAERLYGDGTANYTDAEPMLTRERHRVALARAREEIGSAITQLPPRGEAVLAAHHVREAARAVEELIGTVDVEEVLDRVFGSFCVGK